MELWINQEGRQDSGAFLKAEENGLGALGRADNEGWHLLARLHHRCDTKHVGKEQPTVRGETWTTGPVQEA